MVKMRLYKLKMWCVEICETTNKLNHLEFMENNFNVNENKTLVEEQGKLNFQILEWNPVTFGAKSLEVHQTKIWNSFPSCIKSPVNLIVFKSSMKNWNANFCSRTQSYSLVLFFY